MRLGQEKPVAPILIEPRPCPREIVGHAQDVAVNQLRVLVQIGAGNVRGVLDDRLGAGRKQPVEAPVERDVGDEGNQDGRQHRNDRKQRDDLHVQPRGRPALPSGLHNLPDLDADDDEQKR